MPVIEVLAEPSRRRILDELRGGEQPVHVLVERVARVGVGGESELHLRTSVRGQFGFVTRSALEAEAPGLCRVI